MKILKPGKVEQRKFVCQGCGCELVANKYETAQLFVRCPTCFRNIGWSTGEPYEEPTLTDADRLAKLLFDSMPMCSVGRYDLAADNLIANGVTFREG